MLKEFAVDPGVMGASFQTFRYLYDQFGVDKGRLISRFPKKWKRLVIEAVDKLPDGLNKERMVARLEDIDNKEDGWLTLVASNRPYELPGEDWLNNAIHTHAQYPFHAIICDRDDPTNQLIDAVTCDENNPLFSAATSQVVSRTANDLATVATPLLQNCRKLRLVDPYFDPTERRWLDSLAAILSLIPDITRVDCEFHLQEREETRYRIGSPSTPELIRRLQNLRGVIPDGGTLRIIRWKEKRGGERFHRRYLLTESAGLNYEGGLDTSTGADQTTDVSLLDREHHASRWAEYDLTSQVYELHGPVLVVDADGNTREL